MLSVKWLAELFAGEVNNNDDDDDETKRIDWKLKKKRKTNSLFYLRDQEETMLKKRFHLFYSDRKTRWIELVKFDLSPLQLSQESTLGLETNDRCCILEFERWCTEKKTKRHRTSKSTTKIYFSNFIFTRSNRRRHVEFIFDMSDLS